MHYTALHCTALCCSVFPSPSENIGAQPLPLHPPPSQHRLMTSVCVSTVFDPCVAKYISISDRQHRGKELPRVHHHYHHCTTRLLPNEQHLEMVGNIDLQYIYFITYLLYIVLTIKGGERSNALTAQIQNGYW